MTPVRAAAIAAALLAGALLIAAAAAQTPDTPVSAPDLTITPTRATVGDRITLTIRVDAETGVMLTAPGFGADFGGLEVLAVAPAAEEHRGDGTTRTIYSYELTSFKTGIVTIPELAIGYTAPDGTSGELKTERQTITIDSVLAPGETELRPLKPQLDIGQGAPSPVLPVLFVAGFAALTAFGYALHRRIGRILPPPPVFAPAPAVTSPEDRARAELAAIAAAGIAATDTDEYYARIAATVRRYLTERFGFPAYALTRSEMEGAMVGAGVERWPSRLTANLLAQCDAVEFAGFRPAPERCDADMTAAYEIIDLTATPGPEAAVEEAVAAPV